MTVRTTKSTVTFTKPFVLGDLGETLPAGTYEVETDEALLEGVSFNAYRRVQTLFHIPLNTGQQGLTRTLSINHDDLTAALSCDKG